MAEDTPAPKIPTKIMKDGKEPKIAITEALRMPHQLTSMDEDDMPTLKAKITKEDGKQPKTATVTSSMEDDMPTLKAKVLKDDIGTSNKIETVIEGIQDITAKREKEPSSTDSQNVKGNEGNPTGAKCQTSKEKSVHMPTPKQYTQQNKSKTFEEKTRFSKVVPPTSLISICIDIPSNILIKVKDAAFEIATAFGLMLTFGMLVIIVAVFIVPDYLWNRIWPAKPLDLKAKMEKQNREEKELEKQLGYSDNHRRLLSDEISDLELEYVGIEASKEKGKGKETTAGEKTAEVRDEKVSELSAEFHVSGCLELGSFRPTQPQK